MSESDRAGKSKACLLLSLMNADAESAAVWSDSRHTDADM